MSRIPTNLEDFRREYPLSLPFQFYLINSLNTSGWVERARTRIATWRIEVDSEDESEDELELDHDQYYQGLYEDDFEYSPCPPGGDRWDIEWVYIYDLDLLAFTIDDNKNGIVHLRLDNIPRGSDGDVSDWIKLVHYDSLECICRSPYGSDEHYAKVHTPQDPLAMIENVQLFEAARPSRIDTTTWMSYPKGVHLSLSRKLATIATEGLIAGLFSKFSVVHSPSAREPFKKLAMELMTAACPGGSTFDFDQPKPNTSSEVKITISSGTTYWFRGRLIVLANGLDSKDIFESFVGMIIRRVRELSLKECTAILWSVDHVAVFVISGDEVSCSEAIPFVAAFGRDEDKFRQGLGLIAHYLPPPCSEVVHHFSSALPFDVFSNIMRFASPESARMLGRTSKALRIEWLKQPACGPYTLLSSLEGNGFLAHDEKADALIKLSILPPKCLPYVDWDGYADYDSSLIANNDEHADIRYWYRIPHYYFHRDSVHYKVFFSKM